MNFPTLILYLLNLRKHANQTELDQFFKTLANKKEASQHITKSAFFQSRKQLSPVVFKDLNRQLIDCVYEEKAHTKTWKGFRLCAIDGTSIRLPSEPDIIKHFGVQRGRPVQAPCAMGMASVFYDVLNHMVIDSSINANHTSERECAAEHLRFSDQNDLIIYDRGYLGFCFYALHIQQNLKFCVREKTNQNPQIKSFLKSNQKETLITLSPDKSAIRKCNEKHLPITPITLRLVRVDLPDETEVLITNLMDKELVKAQGFKSLFHQRWGIEENYKRLKQWAEIENFSGKSALSIEQDFYAKIVTANLTSLTVMAAQKETALNKRHLQCRYQINFAQALSKMKHTVVKLILNVHDYFSLNIKKVIHYLSQTIEAIRPGRSVPRRIKHFKNDIHFPAYKSSL